MPIINPVGDCCRWKLWFPMRSSTSRNMWLKVLWGTKRDVFILGVTYENMRDIFRLGPAQDAHFSFIIWYATKPFIYCRNRTNLWERALIYFSIRSIWSYMRFMLGNSTIVHICDTQHLNILCIISYFDIFPFLNIISITTYMLLF